MMMLAKEYIISDLEKYIDLLPTPRKLVGALVGALAFIASAAAIIDSPGLKDAVSRNLQ